MSASRASGLAYIGVDDPVVALVTRPNSASALRAMWVRTCPRVQPGQRLGSPMLPGSSERAVARSCSVCRSDGDEVGPEVHVRRSSSGRSCLHRSDPRERVRRADEGQVGERLG
jgi:hypothetical protein